MMSRNVGMVLAAGMLCAPVFCAPEAALADKVGVAAAVEPDAFSGQGTPLKIGKSVFYNERISTSSSGLVQVLLVDGSTFTVGPGSSLVIDKFVYNPNKKTGEMVATFSKGTMRFVGGRLSKNDGGVRVKTPAGQLAIRGGIVQAAFGRGKSLISFIYGDYAQLTLRNGGVLKAFQPGNTIDLSIGRVRPTTAQDVRYFAQAFAKGKVQHASVKTPSPQKPPKFESGIEAAIKNESEYTRILGSLKPVNTPGKGPSGSHGNFGQPVFRGASASSVGGGPGGGPPSDPGGPTPPPVVDPPSDVGRCGGAPNCGRFGNGTSPEGRGRGLANRPDRP
jgi:hypothetical protein